MTTVDGISLEGSSYGMCVSSRVNMVNRMAVLDSRQSRSLRFVCLRDDGMVPELYAEAAYNLRDEVYGVILESCVPESLRAAVEALPGRRPLIYSPLADQRELIAMAADLDVPIAVSGADGLRTLALAEEALAAGCADVVLAPWVRSLKGCLETSVQLGRLTDLPMMVRAGSGEYALALATVGVLRGVSLTVVDDLDMWACDLLDDIVYNFDP